VSTIYSRQFKPQKVQAKQLALALKDVANINGQTVGVEVKVFKAVQTFLTALSDVMLNRPQTVLVQPEMKSITPSTLLAGTSDLAITHRPVSLALVRMRTWSAHTQNIAYELHVQGEAAVAAALVLALQRCSPKDDIFVATPHRIQREAVRVALSRAKIRDVPLEDAMDNLHLEGSEAGKVTVDTIERLQGSDHISYAN